MSEKTKIVDGEKQVKLVDDLTKILADFQTKNKVYIQWVTVPRFLEVEIEEKEEEKTEEK